MQHGVVNLKASIETVMLINTQIIYKNVFQNPIGVHSNSLPEAPEQSTITSMNNSVANRAYLLIPSNEASRQVLPLSVFSPRWRERKNTSKEVTLRQHLSSVAPKSPEKHVVGMSLENTT